MTMATAAPLRSFLPDNMTNYHVDQILVSDLFHFNGTLLNVIAKKKEIMTRIAKIMPLLLITP
ncbi:MAG: hypothetical protein JXA41_04285 [Deltaproteobacteria bacterium]|nr:hypothetical protein [Deltaproteobacteria bacterium]